MAVYEGKGVQELFLLPAAGPCSAAVCLKSFVLSSLPIRKVLVLLFAGGVSPHLPAVSILFSVSYPQHRRSYYLFFNYLFFTTCLGDP